MNATERPAMTESKVDVLPEDVVSEVWPPDPGGMRVYRPRGVKVTHRPTGLSAARDDERSQHMNRDKALAELSVAVAAVPALIKAAGTYEEAVRVFGVTSPTAHRAYERLCAALAACTPAKSEGR